MNKLIQPKEEDLIEEMKPSVSDRTNQPSVDDENTQILVVDEKKQISVVDEHKQISFCSGMTPAKLRVLADIEELHLPINCWIKRPIRDDDLLKLEVTICPDQGFYRNGIYVFTIKIPPCYPFEAPIVKCKTGVFHPNISYQGNVGLSILREGWLPVLGVKAIIYALYYLFLDIPIWEGSENIEAALVLVEDPKLFETLVRGTIGNHE